MTLLNIIYRLIIKSTRALQHVLCILQSTINDSLQKAGLLTQNNCSKQLLTPYKLASIKHGLQSADSGLSIKHGQGIKRGLHKNSFRKVKLRETESGLAQHETVVPAPCLTHKHSFSRSCSLFFPMSTSHGEVKHTAQARKVILICCYSRQLKLNSEFCKKRSQKRIQFIVLNQ